jgi:hypothetical protein
MWLSMTVQMEALFIFGAAHLVRIQQELALGLVVQPWLHGIHQQVILLLWLVVVTELQAQVAIRYLFRMVRTSQPAIQFHLARTLVRLGQSQSITALPLQFLPDLYGQ